MTPGCEHFRRLLSLSWDQTLDAPQEKELQAHLDRCPACRKFKEDLEKIFSELEETAPAPGDSAGRASRIGSLLQAKGKGERKRLPWAPIAAAALLAGALLFLLLGPGRAPSLPVSPVIRIAGLARPAEGAGFSTPDVRGRAATLHLADGSLLDLEGNTEVSFLPPEKGDRVRVFLEKGKVTAFVSHRPGRFLVETGAGTAEALGTSFEVEVTPPEGEREETMGNLFAARIPGTVMKVAVLAGSILLHTAWGRESLEAGRKKEITTWSARGRVVDGAGKPVKGARVWVDNGEPFQSMVGERPSRIPWRTFHEKARFSNWLLPGPYTAGPAQTGKDGRFLVPNVPSPLKGRILVLHPDFLEKVIPVSRKWIVRDGTVDAGTIRLERGLTISGRVLRSDGSPAAGARVALAFDRKAMRYQDQPGALRMTRADGKGRFLLRGIDPSWHHLVLGCWEEMGIPLEKPVDPGGRDLVLTLRLPSTKGLKLSVTVLEAAGGTPLPGSVGLLFGTDDPGLSVPLARAQAGRDGRILFQGLPAGEFQLVVVPPDQAGKIGSWSPPPWSFRKTVAAGTSLACRLDPPAGIRGRVTDALTGRPVERFRLEAHPSWSWFGKAYRERFGHPDSPSLSGDRYRRDGLFRLPTLRAGEWKLFVCANGYHPAEKEIAVKPGGGPEVRFELQPASGTLSGVAVDSSGTPLEGALVEAYEWSPRRYGLNRVRKITGPGGAFLLDRLLLDPGIVLKVWIRKKGYLKKEILFKKGEPRPASLETVVLQRECVLTGRIVDSKGAPLDRLRLRLYRGSFRGKGGWSALTGRDGRFTFRSLPPGRFQLVLGGRKLAEVELPEPGARVDLPPKKAPRKDR